MSKTKLFIISFLLTGSFFFFADFVYQTAGDYFFALALEKNPLPMMLSANINTQTVDLKACKIEDIKARSFLSFLVDLNKKEDKILFSKEENKQLPIASLTKLMSAVVAEEFYSSYEKVRVSSQAVSQLDTAGSLKAGEWLSKEELLKIMLIESSNDAAFALGELIGEDGFVGLMNLEAKEMGLNNSVFFNASGLDPEDVKMQDDEINLSTTHDLALLMKNIITYYPEILAITGNKEFPLYLENGSLHHTLESTNELLGEPFIIGGKTGLTEKALGCLIIVLKTDQKNKYIVNVLLGSLDRFAEMEILNNCSLAEIL